MLNIYLNTSSNMFLDASGNGFPTGDPEFSVGGKEEIHFFLKKETPNWGTQAARPADWTADNSWGKIPGISAMVTVDDDYRKFIQGVTTKSADKGARTITVSIPEPDDIPMQGVVRVFNNDSTFQAIFYSKRDIQEEIVTFSFDDPLAEPVSAGLTIDCTAAPLAQAYLAPERSNWNTGELVFDLILDSERMRAENDYSDRESVTIMGVELLLYSVNDGIVQILKAFLLGTAVLRNVQGNPGFNAPVPQPLQDKITSEINSQLEDVTERMTPVISDNGNWVIDGVDTGKSSVGRKGDRGETGESAGFATPVLNVASGAPGTEASGTIAASGPDTAKVFTINLTIPKGDKGDRGEKGDPMEIDATGVTEELSAYDSQPKGFAFLATDTGMMHIKNSDSPGDWSAPVGFQGPAGKDGKDGKDGTNGIDGVDGYTPVRGTDYWTEEDIATIKSYVDDAILNGAW